MLPQNVIQAVLVITTLADLVAIQLAVACTTMDAIGKIEASIASASQETTVALANADFDLSLFRIEAPPEYKLLGSALAKSKRNVAEDGPAHVTARRLGSLFQSILPETPVCFT